MKNIIKQIKNIFNTGPAPYEAKGFRSGFVILFAVTLSSILLAIALGVANVALKEVQFGTSAKDTNNSFFAADTGAECALFNDKTPNTSFAVSGSTGYVTCEGISIPVSGVYPTWNFVLSNLGSDGASCAKVTVDKSNALLTSVIAKGYNNGGSTHFACTPGTSAVERELDLNY